MSNCDEPHPRLWIRPADDDGNEVDQRLIDAAYKIWPRARLRVIRYLGSDEEAPRIVENAVSQASKAERNGPIKAPESYLYSAIARAARREAEARERFVPFDPVMMDQLQKSDWRDSENRAAHRILMEQLKAFMDNKTRRMFELRCLDYDWERIAAVLCYKSGHSAEVQFQKGIVVARQRLNGKKPGPRMVLRKDPDTDDRS